MVREAEFVTKEEFNKLENYVVDNVATKRNIDELRSLTAVGFREVGNKIDNLDSKVNRVLELLENQ